MRSATGESIIVEERPPKRVVASTRRLPPEPVELAEVFSGLYEGRTKVFTFYVGGEGIKETLLVTAPVVRVEHEWGAGIDALHATMAAYGEAAGGAYRDAIRAAVMGLPGAGEARRLTGSAERPSVEERREGRAQVDQVDLNRVVRLTSATVFLICALSIPAWLAFKIILVNPLLSIFGIVGSATFFGMTLLRSKPQDRKDK